MFESMDVLSSKLAATGYFIDPVMTQVVYLAAKLQKPLLLEGPAGSGKTRLALSVSSIGSRIHPLLLRIRKRRDAAQRTSRRRLGDRGSARDVFID